MDLESIIYSPTLTPSLILDDMELFKTYYFH